MRLRGVVLAAGAGRRMGLPKALLTDAGVPRTLLAARELADAGCAGVTVVLGARAEEAAALLEEAVRRDGRAAPWLSVVVAEEWAAGMAASLAVGLGAGEPADGVPADAVLVTLVDLPDVGAAVGRRVVQAWTDDGARPDALLRATYEGRPGHPVLVGRDHWVPLAGSLAGDVGARTYLERHRVRSVSCEDLATGRDVDRPEDLRGPTGPGGR